MLILITGGDFLTENERIREIRKSLNMTLEKFGEKVGVTRASMSNVENGNRSVTEQMRKSICREFNVDYIWLTTGEGEMFIDSDDMLYEKFDRIMAGENDLHKKLLKWCITSFDDDDLHILEKMIDSFIKEFSKKTDE